MSPPGAKARPGMKRATSSASGFSSGASRTVGTLGTVKMLRFYGFFWVIQVGWRGEQNRKKKGYLGFRVQGVGFRA